ncbi:MAG: glucan ABC transporter ATP-binding protein/ permease [Xanthobacteraceae bacterium]|nr:glucan ABC transporter ATP-binding protein/ permease [Xanthobacteraceae bacterium]QYK44754.1 MAG: glucan ABC transporter ATP-binding protein/ permease [Xanthobacteraceae bacterium]HMN50893.1 glucan ABC transporter ATP-binding protein/ permease [Xanthobacteraceae bacterium]
MTFIRLYSRVLAMLGPQARLGVILAIANILLAVAAFAEPILFGRIIDNLIASQTNKQMPTVETLGPLLAAWVGFGLFTIASGVLVALHADRLAHKRRLGIITGYFEHVLHLPLAYHGGTHSGRLMKVMLQGADALWGTWLSFFREQCVALVSLFVLLPIAITLNWRLGLLLVILVIIFAVLTSFVINRTISMQQRVESFHSDLAERAADALGNIALIQSYTRTEAEVTGMRNVVERLLEKQLPVLSWWALVAVATRAATTITILSIFLVGVWLYTHNLTTIGEIVTFVNIAALFIGKLEQTASFANRLVTDAPRLQEFFDVLDAAPSVHDKPNAIEMPRPRGAVDFEHVSLSYDGKRAAVDDISLHADPGESIALVGATGAGKSTALAIMHRAFDPQKGAVKIDGVDIRDYKLTSLRRNIGVVFQEALLFDRSIEENLKVGKPDATDAEIDDALRRAQAKEFIARLPEGLKSNVGERGRALSGGERQRLAIARALLKNPPILVLDEATSALDAGTESLVQQALEEVMKGRTTFVIAHRLATIRNADRILVFHEGKIVESGSFDELVAKNGRFAQLAKAQFMVSEKDNAKQPV